LPTTGTGSRSRSRSRKQEAGSRSRKQEQEQEQEQEAGSRRQRGIESMEFYFDHEKLEVYQLAIRFVAWTEILLEDCEGKAASAKKHLDEASSSIPNNIAEGNGKWSKKERKKFFEVARASALECASCLDILVAKRRISADRTIEGKEKLRSIVNLLTRLIKNLSEDS
jgi:four helix bundle protein